MATRILSFCPKSAKSTLVLGCGSSPLTGKFPGKVTGLDINPWKTRFVEGKLPNVTFVTRDIRDPLGSLGEFDLIVASEVLEHIPARELSSTVSKLCGLLSLGGRFVVAAPDYDNWLGSLVETLFHDYHYRFSFEDLDWDFAMQSFKFVGKRRFFWDTVACYKR
jgi:SAM-dependent methyltransferase